MLGTRRIGIGSLLLALSLVPAAASAATDGVRKFSIADVGARLQPRRTGTLMLANVDVNTYIQVDASGAIRLPQAQCPRSVDPYGCLPDPTTPGAIAIAPGTLEGMFVTNGGQEVGPWIGIGESALLRVPSGAQALVVRVHGAGNAGTGSFHVTAEALPSDPALRGAMGTRAIGPSRRGVLAIRQNPDPSIGTVAAAAIPTTRSAIAHLLRRMGFSDTPEDITAVQQAGAMSWITAQLTPSKIDDSAAAPYVMTPVQIASQFGGSQNSWQTWFFENAVNSKRQLLQKMWLYWIDTFSVNQANIRAFDSNPSPAMIGDYLLTLQTDALGNFQTLLLDASAHPATQAFLNELDANGNATSPPNENFGREIMQLYSMGPSQLNPDGTPALNATGGTISQYSEADVKQAALMLTGFQIDEDSFTTNTGQFSDWVRYEVWNQKLHYTSPTHNFTIMGKTISDPGGAQCAWSALTFPAISSPCVYTNFVSVLAHEPTTWAYQSKQLIQRLVEENPSPAFVQRISTVWGANVDSPTQIATVLKAIMTDPEFYAAEDSMVKEPIEFEVNAIRALHGADVPANVLYPTGAYYLNWTGPVASLAGEGQDLISPPSVFGFYPLGDKEAMLSNNIELLNRISWQADYGLYWQFAPGPLQTGEPGIAPCGACSGGVVNASFMQNFTTPQFVSYLLDALVDGGDINLRTTVTNYLTAHPTDRVGALWLILASPEYEVN